jgi:hypothetical protein
LPAAEAAQSLEVLPISNCQLPIEEEFKRVKNWQSAIGNNQRMKGLRSRATCKLFRADNEPGGD